MAVVNEIERVYHEDTSKTQGDFEPIYRASFKKTYNFARLMYFYTQSPTTDIWDAIINGMGVLAGASAFERDIAVVCFRVFLGTEKYEEDAEVMERVKSAVADIQTDAPNAA